MEWKTRITELLGCKYPILQGALSGLGKAEFAAAVSKAGGHGTITAGSYSGPEKLRQGIRKYHELSKEPFSVNISLHTDVNDEEGMLKVALEEGAPVLETSVYNADEYGKRAKGAGLKWIHKTATLNHALHAQRAGADGVIIVGLEGIGKKNIAQLTTMTTLLVARDELDIPLVIAGGIGDGRGLLMALAMGADGIMMGTRFMATKECPIAARYKQRMVDMPADDPTLKYKCLNMPDPKAYEEVMNLRDKIPMEEWVHKVVAVNKKEENWKDAAPREWAEDTEEATANWATLISQAVAVIDDFPTCKELIERMIKQAEEQLDSLEFLKALKS